MLGITEKENNMATTERIICDRCGKETNSFGRTVFWIKVVAISLEKDICDDCKRDFEYFMDGYMVDRSVKSICRRA